MYIEFHLLQNFVPSNLNRDDTGAPKDCIFGGFRRARISSQCQKKSIRDYPVFSQVIGNLKGDIGVRTKRLANALHEKLLLQDKIKIEQEGQREVVSRRVAQNIIKCIGLGFPTDNNTEELQDYSKTQYLLFLGNEEISDLVNLAVSDNYWPAMSLEMNVELKDVKGKAKNAKTLKEEREKLFRDGALEKCFDETTFAKIKGMQNAFKNVVSKERIKNNSFAADIALFGRMIADNSNMNVDAACQMAHAISTNEVEMKMDFFTAVDDLLPDDTQGSDMMGIVEFNSACYYRYARIDLNILKTNLGCSTDPKKKNESYDPEIVKAAIEGFLIGIVEATPTGMRNSTGHFNPPSYIRALVRSSGAPWNLANAFVQPVRAKSEEGGDLINTSVKRLENYISGLTDAFGKDSIKADLITSHSLIKRPATDVNLKEMIKEVKNAITEEVRN